MAQRMPRSGTRADANPDADADALALDDTVELEQFRRSPHPYLRHGDQTQRQSPGPTHRAPRPSQSRPSSEPPGKTMHDKDGRTRRKRAPHSPSESGTEADDEGYSLVKALPAPPLRPHKGLRESRTSGPDEWASPLLTPTQIDDEGRKLFEGYFARTNRTRRKGDAYHSDDDEARRAKQKYLQRRRNELVRRTTETALLAGIATLAVRGCDCWVNLLAWHRAAFDPATILYPPILPVLIALSLFASSPKPLLPNMLLGLAALPARLIPFRSATLGYSPLHWLVSIMPLIAAENTDIPSRLFAQTPYKLKLPPPNQGLDPELLVTLFALHQALLPPLYYLTTTSLLPAELHLLSIGLINLLLFSDTPQAAILGVLLWLGGLGVFLLCGNILKWGVALARIPRWRLRRAGQVIRARQNFLQVLTRSLGSKRDGSDSWKDVSDSDADEEPRFDKPLQKTKSLKVNVLDSVRHIKPCMEGSEPRSAAEATKTGFQQSTSAAGSTPNSGRKRRNTLPVLVAEDHTSQHRYSNRRQSGSIVQSYLSLTPTEATMRKWLYAGYFYVIVVGLILGPIRYSIGKYALHQHEPFGWAISYLFGNISRVRWEVFTWDLNWWVPLPTRRHADDMARLTHHLSLAEYVRRIVLGEATTRLLLCVYCAGTILAGLVAVFSLSAVVEVDTRRKVFHGTMVAMLLPTIFIDPCFVALALALVLAIFLLLDLIRASQLPPLSKPIARFLTPYVDGRDLRGPVVVSHIFLLIGCAIPLWLSLAGVERAGDEPWQGWEVEDRDVSMVAGVICVGMGDAAASLVGRRYGRRKWPWAGGKSLEGSLAFAVAVSAGLVVSRVWLRVGWESGAAGHRTEGEWAHDALLTLGKAALCATGASLNEAVLTGGNDNVIVPVILWVLVRGVRL
ncbi:hypothetical protein J4E85_005092 [Alternaria conjuncta]|uniref:uncharacterized protein n=1 Tax=Alternaria conjuncta TaxID=181017 RepID=UPI00221FD7C3|nr:uncharacterized protein J4E85_005092 [Alternaria conjuncta]KAI4928475.1 hypothetical protein J4E85_005092 [Alternaria conjuncta]